MNPTQQQLGRWQHRLNDRMNDAGKYKSQDKRFLLKCGNGANLNTLAKKRRQHLARHPNDLQAKRAANPQPRKEIDKHGLITGPSHNELCELKARADFVVTTVNILHNDEKIASGKTSQEAWSQIDPHQYCFAGGLPTNVRWTTSDEEETFTLFIWYRSTVRKWISFERRENADKYEAMELEQMIHDAGYPELNEAKVMYCESKFQAKTVAELKEVCRSHALPVSGTKGRLIGRLVTFFGKNPQHGTEFEVDGGEEE